MIATISYWSRCGAFRPQWLLLPSPVGNSPFEGDPKWRFEGLQECDPSDCVCENPGLGGRIPAIRVGPSSCDTYLITAQHAFLQLFLSQNFWTPLLNISRNSVSFRVYVGHKDDKNCMRLNGKMLNFVVWSHVIFFFFCLFLSFVFLGLHLGHMEVPRLGVQSELLPPA